MTKQEQLATLVCASEFIGDYVADLAYCGYITEEAAKVFDEAIEKIDNVAEEIRHETTPPTYVYIVWEDWHGIIGYHKTFESAKKQLMKDSGYEQLVKNVPLNYDGETRWGWDVLYIEKIELEE